jgi:hypothetical protein
MAAISEQHANGEADNVRLFPDRQASQSFPRRSYAIDVIAPGGFQVVITLNDMKLDQLEQALDQLLERGYMPANPTPAAAGSTAAPGTPPLCPYHGPMKESEKRPGTFYCPKKLADGSGYCKEKYPKG